MEENNSEQLPKADENKSVKLDSHTPIVVEPFTLSDILDKDTIKVGLNAFIGFISQLSDNEKANNEIEKQKLDNELAIRQLEVEETRLELETTNKKYDHIKWFDIRNKVFTIVITIIILCAIYILKTADILDKSEAKTIVIITLTIGLTSNADLLKNVFPKKKA